MKKKIILAATTLVMGMASCDNTPKTMDINGDWKVATIAGEEVPETMEEATLSFDASNNSYHGVTGVNLINGEYELKEGNLTLSEGAMTRMMGDSISDAVEIKYISAIHAVTTVAEEEGKLLLMDIEGNTLMTLVRKQ